MDRERTRALIELHEGKRRFAYRCTEGFWTIGIGRNIDQASGKGLSDDEIAYLLANDLHECHGWLGSYYPWFNSLSDVRKAVLVDMRFNLGPDRFTEFRKTLGLVSVGRYADAATQMLQSKWAGQVGKRAIRLSEMMRTGEWPKELTD